MSEVREVLVRFLGNADNLDHAANKAHGSLSKIGTVAKALAVGALVALGAGLKTCASAAMEAQESQSRMEAALKAAGISYKQHAAVIDSVIQKTSRLAGLDDEDLQNAFTRLARATGDVNRALKDTALVADIARGAHISLEAATKIVQNVELGRVTGLRRLGVSVSAVTESQDRLKQQIAEYIEKHGPLTAAEKAHFDSLMAAAKASDLNATKTAALAAAQEKYAGAAKAYGETAAGGMDRFNVAIENLQEALGEKLLPVIAKFANILAGLLDFLGKHSTIVTIFAAALGVVAAGILAASAATAVWNAVLALNPIVAIVVALAALGVALVVAYKKCETFRDIVNAVFNVVKVTITTVVGVVQSVMNAMIGSFNTVISFLTNNWQLIAMIITGPFAPLVALATNAFGIRDALVGAFNATIDAITGIMSGIGGLVSGWFNAAVAAITGAVDSAVGAATSFATGIVGAITGVLSSIAETVRGWFSSAVGAISGTIGSAVSTAGNWASGVLGAIRTGLGTVANVVGGLIHDAITAVFNSVAAATNAGKAVGSAILTACKNALDDIVNTARTLVHNAITAVTNLAGSALSAGRTIGDKIVSGAKNGLSDVVSTIRERVVDAINAVSNLAGAAFNHAKTVGVNIAKGVIEGIGNLANLVYQKIKNAVNEVISKINAIRIPGFSISIDLPSPIPDINFSWGGADPIPHIPYLAAGMRNFPGGWAVVGEKGPELVNLPRGSNVLPAPMATIVSRAESARHVNELHIHIDGGTFIGTELARAARELAPALRLELQRLGFRVSPTGSPF